MEELKMANKVVEIKAGKTVTLKIFESELMSELRGEKDTIRGTLCIGDYLYIKITMRKGSLGWFVAYPSYKGKDGYIDLVFAKKEFNMAIVKAFTDKINDLRIVHTTPTTADIETAEELPF